MTPSRISGSSDAFSRRVEAAVPEALDYLPESWAARDRLAQAIVGRVLAAADRASDPHVWLLWGRREEMSPELFGCFADRETALAAEDAAKKLPRWRDWVDIWVAPWENRTTPKLRAAVARSLARKPDPELARLRAVEQAAREVVKPFWGWVIPEPHPLNNLRSALSEPAAEGTTSARRCELCGQAVRPVSSSEGTAHYEPAGEGGTDG